MGRPKKIVDKVDLVYNNSDIQINDIEEQSVVAHVSVIDRNPLHTKYNKYILQARDSYINGLTYPEAMEILRYCEGKRKVQFGLNMSCPSCMLGLIRMFDSIRD